MIGTLQISIVCEIQNRIANVILYLCGNIVEKYFIYEKRKVLVERLRKLCE